MMELLIVCSSAGLSTERIKARLNGKWRVGHVSPPPWWFPWHNRAGAQPEAPAV